MRKLAVFASGNGSNFEAIQASIEAGEVQAEIVLVVVDQKNAAVIDKAKQKGIFVFVFSAKDYDSKEAYEKEIIDHCHHHQVEWIILTGYMRILSAPLLNAFENRILNVHPSLLPAFKGKDAIGQAIEYGVKVMGVSIHYVNSELDGGKIIAQECFSIDSSMSRDYIESTIHAIEHQLYSKTIQKLLEETK